MRLSPILATFLVLATVGAAQAQYAQTDRYQDHRWTPDNSGFQLGTVAVPGVAPGSAASAPAVVVEQPKPEPPKVEGIWKYASNGHVENTCTAGASVYELVPGCYDKDNGQCWGSPPYPTCKMWGKNGGQGNCPTGWPTIGVPFVQTLEYASVGFMYDWKGTCYPSTITPYR